MAIVKKTDTAEGFGKLSEKENAVGLLRYLMDTEGFSRKTDYLFNIVNTLIENEKEIYERVPQEVLGGLYAGGRKNVEASFVARANESPVRQDQGGFEEFEDGPFRLWDRQENSLAEWAMREGCWHDDILDYANRTFGEEIAHGTEAKVFRYDGCNVAKVLSSSFNPQETLDRISLMNFISPQTGLELIGLGRGEYGSFCFLLKQPFIQGEHINPGEIEIDGLDDFECVDENAITFEFATPRYLLSDLHDENVIRSPEGRPMIIDCNLFLNTPELGKGGEWIIPEPDYSKENIPELVSELKTFLPKSIEAKIFLDAFSAHVPTLKSSIQEKGYHAGGITVRTKDGRERLVIVQNDPNNPGSLLWNDTDAVYKLIRNDKRFSSLERVQLSQGFPVKKDGTTSLFSLDKGRVENVKELNLKNTVKGTRKNQISL